jgi:hypothetical protein
LDAALSQRLVAYSACGENGHRATPEVRLEQG